MSANKFSRTALRAALIAALGLGAAAAGSCVSERATATISTDDCVVPPSAAGLPVVFIKQFTYVPAQLHVSAGQSVAWVNCESDGTPHTATADDASFNSGLLNRNDAYVRVFPTAGTVPYHCDLHPFMKATVIVD
jgi:plastocyanin